MTPPQSGARPLGPARYASLRTFRPDGTWAETPIWFVQESDHLYLRTGLASAKIRRIGRDPRVELRACDYRGRYKDGAVAEPGTATVCEEPEQRHGEVLLKQRYGWQWNIVPMIPLPGLSNPHPDLSIRERFAWARSPDPWPGTCVVRIDLGPEPT